MPSWDSPGEASPGLKDSKFKDFPCIWRSSNAWRPSWRSCRESQQIHAVLRAALIITDGCPGVDDCGSPRSHRVTTSKTKKLIGFGPLFFGEGLFSRKIKQNQKFYPKPLRGRTLSAPTLGTSLATEPCSPPPHKKTKQLLFRKVWFILPDRQ